MKLFAPSALPVEASHAVPGKVLGALLALTALAPWWQDGARAVSGVESLLDAVTAIFSSTDALLERRAAANADAVAWGLYLRRTALGIAFTVLGAGIAALAPRRRFPRLPFFGVTLAVAGPFSTLLESTLILVAWRAEIFVSSRDRIFLVCGVAMVPLVASIVAAIGLLSWRDWAFWIGAPLAFFGFLALPFGLEGTGWGVRVAALLAALLFFWEARSWDELAADADDPDIASRRAFLLGETPPSARP